MKTLIAFLLGYLAANWVASKGGIQQAISSVETPSTTQTTKTAGYTPTTLPYSATHEINSTVNTPPSTMPVSTPYSPYSSLRVFRVQ